MDCVKMNRKYSSGLLKRMYFIPNKTKYSKTDIKSSPGSAIP